MTTDKYKEQDVNPEIQKMGEKIVDKQYYLKKADSMRVLDLSEAERLAELDGEAEEQRQLNNAERLAQEESDAHANQDINNAESGAEQEAILHEEQLIRDIEHEMDTLPDPFEKEQEDIV